ncbi:class III lanthipeptide, partial [Bacillus anthracis]
MNAVLELQKLANDTDV